MSSGKHTTYVVKIFQVNTEVDLSEEIKLAVNVAIKGKGHVNQVEEKKGE